MKAAFLKKVAMAKTVYDYSDENRDSKMKTERLAAINELIEMLNDQRMVTSLFIPHIDLVMEMITKNIFRPLPSLKKNNINLAMSETGVETDEQESDPSWPHIRGIYEIFLQLIVNEACDVKTFKSYITNNFISEVRNCFDKKYNILRDIANMLFYIKLCNLISFHFLVPPTFRFRRNRRKRLLKEHPSQIICQVSPQKKNDQKGNN
jgi:hypothetical protein